MTVPKWLYLKRESESDTIWRLGSLGRTRMNERMISLSEEEADQARRHPSKLLTTLAARYDNAPKQEVEERCPTCGQSVRQSREPAMTDLNNRTVIRARQDVADRYDRPPTATEIADYLKADKDAVLACLRDLQRQRIFKERRRRSERVWVRWSE